MLHRLKAFLQDLGPDSPVGVSGEAEIRLAAAALMAEAARLDGRTDPAEREMMRRLLRERFELDEGEAAELSAQAERKMEQSSQYFGYVNAINQRFTHAERVELLEMLWRVIYADGQQHDYEANLMRRLAGLLYVSDRECGEARQRVLANPSAAG